MLTSVCSALDQSFSLSVRLSVCLHVKLCMPFVCLSRTFHPLCLSVCSWPAFSDPSTTRIIYFQRTKLAQSGLTLVLLRLKIQRKGPPPTRVIKKSNLGVIYIITKLSSSRRYYDYYLDYTEHVPNSSESRPLCVSGR